jgi:hypothetical protein
MTGNSRNSDWEKSQLIKVTKREDLKTSSDLSKTHLLILPGKLITG